MLILVANLSYSQYPVAKKIGNDSVVIMTIKQCQEINENFSVLKDSINRLNSKNELFKDDFRTYQIRNGMRLQSIYESYLTEYNTNLKTRAELDSFKMMYMANKKIYLKQEEDHMRENRRSVIFTLISFFITVIIVGTN